MCDNRWYQSALHNGTIDHWNFNAAVFQANRKRPKPYQLYAAASSEVAKALGLRHIRRLSDGLWYGIYDLRAMHAAAEDWRQNGSR